MSDMEAGTDVPAASFRIGAAQSPTVTFPTGLLSSFVRVSADDGAASSDVFKILTLKKAPTEADLSLDDAR